jgi:hypothetical protein
MGGEMVRDGEGRITASEILRRKAEVEVEHGETIPYEELPESMHGLTFEKEWAPMRMTLREKILGFQPSIYIEKYGEKQVVLIRRIEWPWFRVILTQRTVEDHSLVIPPRFGFTRHDFTNDTWHYHLFPFNFVIALSRRVYQVFGWELPAQFSEWEKHWRKTHAAPEPEILVQSNEEGNGKPTQRSDSSPVE